MRIAFNFFETSSNLDTAKIKNVTEYLLIENLYSRLVEYKDARLVPGVSEFFEVKGRQIVFTFSGRVRTKGGSIVGAEDAALSLKRLIFLGRSGHGDIRRFLCPGYKLKSMDDDCPGIKIEAGRLVLEPVEEHFIPLLIPTLESADYSVVPKAALNLKSAQVEIIDHTNTSGPYYVESDSLSGEIVLRANPSHYNYHKAMPQIVKVVPTPTLEGPKKFLTGAVDLVPTSEFYLKDDAKKILADSSQFNVHSTMPSRVNMVVFSPRAVRDFTAEQRFYAVKKYVEVRERAYPVLGSATTVQFFQALSDGTLNSDQLSQIVKLRNPTNLGKFRRKMEIAFFRGYGEVYRKALAADSDFDIVEYDRPPIEIGPDNRPDMLAISTDSAWTENLSLLGHNFEIGAFHLPGLDVEKWFEKYLNGRTKEERILQLNELHFDLLKNAIIVPFNVYPYYAVSTKNWNLDFSKLSSETALWKIRAN